MMQQWQQLAGRYDRLSGRERLGVLLAGSALLAAIAFAGVLEPQLKEGRVLQQKRLAAAHQLAAIKVQQRQLAATQQDTDALARQQMITAQQQLAVIDQQLATLQGRLVPAGQMTALLERLLQANGRLRLVSLKTLPAVPLEAIAKGKVLSTGAGKPASLSAAGLYKHGVEICIQGSYFDLLAYLQAVERLPVNMIWSDLHFKVDQYPVNTLTLTLYTLSLDRIWLSV